MDKWYGGKNTSYIFHDSDTDPDFHPQGPITVHFRDSNITKIESAAKEAWHSIIEDKTPLPTSSIRIYDDSGNYKGTRNFTSILDEQQQMDTTCPSSNHTATFQELTEEEFETLQHDYTPSTPLNSGSSSNACTPHHTTNNMQPISLFTDRSQSSSTALETTGITLSGSSQGEPSLIDENIMDLTVRSLCDCAPNPVQTSSDTGKPTLQTKAAKLIQKVTGHTTLLSE